MKIFNARQLQKYDKFCNSLEELCSYVNLGGGGEYLAAEINLIPHCNREKICYTSDMKYHKRKNKLGFTLAEVLITLGVIGIVAAFTMPSLISKYQMRVFETAFKKQYSVLNNTLDFIQLQEGLHDCYLTTFTCPTESNPYNQCYSSANSDCQVIKQGMINHLKLRPITNDFEYPDQDDVLAEGGITVNKTVNYDYYKSFSAFTLADGAVVMFSEGGISGYSSVVFLVDVNGKKGPNKWGYDAFYLVLSLNNGKIRLTDEYASLAQKGGRLPRTILLNSDKNEVNGFTWN